MTVKRRTFIIAEAGSNWRAGSPRLDLEMAYALIDAAAAADADAVKFQTYRAETVYVAGAGKSNYLAQHGIRKSINDIFKDLAMPYEMIPRLAKRCQFKKIEFMSSAFSEADFRAVDPHVRVHKIASYEITHPRLIELAAASGKPLILSTGASTVEDIDWAVSHFKKKGGRRLILMQCTAKYPAPPEALNLRVIPELARRYGTEVGFSDHSLDPVTAPVAAVALGATCIEKHFTLDRRLAGPDHAFAVNAPELRRMVGAVRDAEKALGDGRKRVLAEEKELRRFAQRAVQSTRDIARGEVLRHGVNIDVLRPGKQPQGIHPKNLSAIEGSRARHLIRHGHGIGKGDYDA